MAENKNHLLPFMIICAAWAQLSGFLFCVMVSGIMVIWELHLRGMPKLVHSHGWQLILAVGQELSWATVATHGHSLWLRLLML